MICDHLPVFQKLKEAKIIALAQCRVNDSVVDAFCDVSDYCVTIACRCECHAHETSLQGGRPSLSDASPL